MQIDYEKINDCYNRINKILVDIGENSALIKRTVSSLKSSELWEGISYDSFKTKTDNIISNLTSYILSTKQLSNVMMSSVEKYKAVDKKVLSALKGLSSNGL